MTQISKPTPRFGRLIALVTGAALAILTLPRAYAGDGGSIESTFDQTFAQQPRRTQAMSSVAPVAPAALPRRSASGLVASSTYAAPPPSFAPTLVPGSLAARVAMLANAGQGRIGVAAVDLTSGRSLQVLGDQPFPLASTIKVAIAATFLDGVDRGVYNLNTQYPLMMPMPSRKFAGVVAPVRPGAMLSALSLMDLALTRSDNQAADALLAAVGGPRAVNVWLRRTGNSGIHMDRDIATLVRDDGAVNPAVTIDRRDSTTPLAMVQLMSGLYRGQWLSASSQQVLLGTMGRCITGRHRLRAELPEGAMIAHKTGTLSNTASDVGIMSLPGGRSIAVAVYVTGQGTKAARDARIAVIARAIYDGYSEESLALNRTAR